MLQAGMRTWHPLPIFVAPALLHKHATISLTPTWFLWHDTTESKGKRKPPPILRNLIESGHPLKTCKQPADSLTSSLNQTASSNLSLQHECSQGYLRIFRCAQEMLQKRITWRRCFFQCLGGQRQSSLSISRTKGSRKIDTNLSDYIAWNKRSAAEKWELIAFCMYKKCFSCLHDF